MILPASSKTQSHDQRSPRSTPIVSFCSLKISLPNTCTVLIFFIAGLLLCLEHVFHWERIASRWRPAFSSHLVSRAYRTTAVPLPNSHVDALIGQNVRTGMPHYLGNKKGRNTCLGETAG